MARQNQPRQSQAGGTQNKALVRQDNVNTVKDLLRKFKGQIEAALPKHMTPDRMARIALTEIRRSDKLQECDPLSFFAAIIKCSQLGLEPGFDASLVPYKTEVQVLPGYRGYTKLARNSGEIQKVSAHVVYENDEYDVELGTEESIKHKPKMDGPRGGKLFCYAVATFKDGTKQIEPMTREEIEDVRDNHSATYKQWKTSPNWPDGNPKPIPAWETDSGEMWKKTVVNRLCKRLPMSAELHELVVMDGRAEGGAPQELKADIFGDEILDHDEERFWSMCSAEGIQRDDPAMMLYLAEVSKFYKMDVLTVQGKYSEDKKKFAEFLSAFIKLQKGPDKPGKVVDAEPEQLTREAPEQPMTTEQFRAEERIPCPNLDEGEWVTEDLCLKCGSRKGCPSHDREPGSDDS